MPHEHDYPLRPAGLRPGWLCTRCLRRTVIPVRVVTVEQAPYAAERKISGRAEAIHSVDIRARTEGKVVQRHVQDGQYVNKGDLLFTLDDAQPKAALALAQAELKSAQASLRQAQQLLSRYQQLKNNHSISRQDVDTAQMQRDVAAAAVEQAQARIAAQQITLGYTRITRRSPGASATAFSSAAWSILPAVCWSMWSSLIRFAWHSRWMKPPFSLKRGSTPILRR
jgi:multidrug efflux pump subunit AcrA (membrane-fusion protein)